MTRLRPATVRDLPRMAEILQGRHDATSFMPDLQTGDDAWSPLCQLLETADVTVAGGAAVEGFLALDGEEVAVLCVADGARGTGIGASLLTAAKAVRPRLSLRTFRTNVGALAFFGRQGFLEVERIDGSAHEERLPDIRLEWRAA